MNHSVPTENIEDVYRQTHSKPESQIIQEKAKKEKQIDTRLSNNFKVFDMFGQTVNMTWNGEDKFRTVFGASITLTLMAILIAFTALKLIDLVHRVNPTVSKTTLYRD